jgi:hypothetical protein
MTVSTRIIHAVEELKTELTVYMGSITKETLATAIENSS